MVFESGTFDSQTSGIGDMEKVQQKFWFQVG